MPTEEEPNITGEDSFIYFFGENGSFEFKYWTKGLLPNTTIIK
jgi:hypothetical protein